MKCQLDYKDACDSDLCRLYDSCQGDDQRGEAMSAEFDFKAAYHKEHDDFCRVESRNYVLEQRIKALEAETTFDPTAQLGGVIPPPSAAVDRIKMLEAENGALIDARDARELFIASLALQLLRLRSAEAALREIAHPLGPYSTGELRDIARKALGEE